MTPSAAARVLLSLGLLTMAAVSGVGAQEVADGLPVVTIDGPTVILFWTDPDSVSDPDDVAGLYAALDQQQTSMADTREALGRLGVADVSQTGRRFIVRDSTRSRTFRASPDSAVVGYLFAAPGRDDLVLYRVQFTEALLEAARRFLDSRW